MESVVESQIITTKCPPTGMLDDTLDRLIGKFNFVTEGMW
jgi:hypothetical protein